ncbi:hypothetical protein [Streptomyces sp. NPDC005374]|uniref:hypothetical protein n=1 Tax=Streptomyces sp. NPDC005374 TaxID=3364713 RepID=UPI0036BE76C3
MSAENTAPAGPPERPHEQPRWAWWVVGIVVPVVGILVAVLLNGSGSSDGDSGKNVQSAPTTSATSPGSTGQAQMAPTRSATKSADKVLYGPAVVEADVSEGGQAFIELDTSSPVVSTSGKGSDVIYGATTGPPTLGIWNSSSHLAPLPEADPAPTAETCMDAVERNGTYNLEAHRGDRFCLLTGEGRVVYMHVLAAPPGRGIGKLDVTVWEAPAV